MAVGHGPMQTMMLRARGMGETERRGGCAACSRRCFEEVCSHAGSICANAEMSIRNSDTKGGKLPPSALTACLRIPDWPHRLGSNYARIIADLGAPRMQLAHLIGSHQWEMPNCTGFSGFVWGLITSQLRRAAISTSLGPVASATCAILQH